MDTKAKLMEYGVAFSRELEELFTAKFNEAYDQVIKPLDGKEKEEGFNERVNVFVEYFIGTAVALLLKTVGQNLIPDMHNVILDTVTEKADLISKLVKSGEIKL